MGLDTTNKVSTISWTNTIENESASFSNKGLRFVKMGTDGNADYSLGLSNGNNDGLYLDVFGWVATIEEAKEVEKNYSRYSLKNMNSYFSKFDFSGNSVPSRCTYTAADGGYQVKLSFDINGLRGEVEGVASGSTKGMILASLYYDDIPYMYRGGDTGGLRTTQSLKSDHAREVNQGTADPWETPYAGHNYYTAHYDFFYHWIVLFAVHA